jgi:N-acetylmuramoyl-L-alanine amidase
MQIQLLTWLARSFKFCSATVLMLALAACSGTTVRQTESANHNSRVSIIVIHHTTSNFEDALETLTQPSDNSVSSHYLIPEPDDVTYAEEKVQTYQLVPEARRAWHAGVSYWAGKSGLNDQSIGIELVNQTYCHASDENSNPYAGNSERICFYPDFADAQLALLVDLLDEIHQRHPGIRPTHIIGHADIAPDRKIDPGPRFPWQRLSRLGYGAWYDDDVVIRFWERFRAAPLPLKNVQLALLAYGYKIDPTGSADDQTESAVRAFQMHFRPSTVTGTATIETTAVLFALIEEYYPEQLDQLLHIDISVGDAPVLSANQQM